MMLDCHPSETTRDRGAVLPLALIFIVVLSVIVAAIAAYTATALRSSRVTTDIVDRISAAESGMQIALEAADVGSCGSLSHGTINRANVTTTCENQKRVENLDGSYALVITGLGVDTSLEFDGSGPGRKCIGGPVYFETGISVDVDQIAAVSGTECSPALAQPGEVRFNVAGGCPAIRPSGPGEGLWDTPQPFYGCNANGWAIAAPTPDLSAFPRASLPALGVTPGACTVYSPGQRVGGTLNITDDAYFQSGVYYFEDVRIEIRDHVTVGKRTDGEFGTKFQWTTTDHWDGDCTAAWTADTPGTGAVWVLGGTSVISIENGGRFGFYPRDLDVDGEPRPVSVISYDTATLGYVPTTLDPDTSVMITRHNGSTRSASFYGLTHVPRGWVDTGTAAANSYIQYIGGLVAARAQIFTTPPVGAFAIYVPSTLVDYYLIESAATLDGISTTVRTVSKAGAAGLEVVTWRVK